jgi:predicted transcriptional regulator
LVWSKALQHLPKLIAKFQPSGYSLSSDLILSLRPQYAEKIFKKQKTVEIRKSFSEKWVGKRAVVYASHPSSSLLGEVRVGSVSQGDPGVIWEKFGACVGCSLPEYAEYVGRATAVWAIQLEEARPYKTPLGIAHVSHLIKRDLRPPQSYCGVESQSDWGAATSVASLLHGGFRAGVQNQRIRVSPFIAHSPMSGHSRQRT